MDPYLLKTYFIHYLEYSTQSTVIIIIITRHLNEKGFDSKRNLNLQESTPERWYDVLYNVGFLNGQTIYKLNFSE